MLLFTKPKTTARAGAGEKKKKKNENYIQANHKKVENQFASFAFKTYNT